MSKPTSPHFKQEIDELEQIVVWFESSDVDLDSALAKFERGMELATGLKNKLETLENKVVQIQAKFTDPKNDENSKQSKPKPDNSTSKPSDVSLF